MKFYAVKFDGLWLGGIAIIAAHSEAQAMELFYAKAEFTDRPSGVSISEIACGGPGVLYFDNGDY